LINAYDGLTPVQQLIVKTCDDVKELLLKKNKAYGNSALEPVRVFSNVSTKEQLYVRIDDKLSRISRGSDTDAVPEDTILDLIGYLVLELVRQEINESI
jgi:hypothetical protein